jgi:N-methylhydantoinase A/oxoprolinase/acetone carboxylase beta subunit
MAKGWRIGIDVGGTFTDAVLIDNSTYELRAKMKIPTTHKEGVAVGVIRILQQLMEENSVAPEDVCFIAHGTTQATNALLEGDVATVGVVGIGSGLDAVKARNDTNVGDIELAAGKYLKQHHVFIHGKDLNKDNIDAKIVGLRDLGSEVIVASGAYSVEDPQQELAVVDAAQEVGLYATGGHEISQLYGLKIRTRTAVVNGSLIPKMMETANLTEQAIRDAGITSTLMIMRCDGGVMSIDEVRKRPILTMLSGLAGGVAGALMYEKISDGLFFEVGGTSVDISAIKDGLVMTKNAQVGGHQTYLTSLDVRTLGVAGGSMIRVDGKAISDVGPRSSHIAGLDYECFIQPEKILEPTLHFVRPCPDDKDNYAVVVGTDGHTFALTLAGAANVLGAVPQGDYAQGCGDSAVKAWTVLADYLGISVEDAAKQALGLAADKLMQVVNELIDEYEMDRGFTNLVGGGGSGGVVIPYMAQREGFKWRIAKNAPYISTIGVALAMVREQIERSIVNPSEGDILKIRHDVLDAMVRAGALAETVDVSVEVDSQRNILRATATGSTELRSKDLNQSNASPQQMLTTAADALNVPEEDIRATHETSRFRVFEARVVTKGFWGIGKKRENHCCVMDREGVVRLKKRRVSVYSFAKGNATEQLPRAIDEWTEYSEANAILPGVQVCYGEKMLNLSGLGTIQAVMSLFNLETEHLDPKDNIIAIIYR